MKNKSDPTNHENNLNSKREKSNQGDQKIESHVISYGLSRHFSPQLRTTAAQYGNGCFDKLWIFTPNVEKSFLRSCSSYIFKARGFNVKAAYQCYSNEHQVSFQLFKYSPERWKIQINPSDTNWPTLKNILRQIMGTKVYKMGQYEITRLDIAVNLPRSHYKVDTFVYSTYCKYRRATACYLDAVIKQRSGIWTGYELGVHPFKFMIYDTSFKDDWDTQPIDDEPPIRIEAQLCSYRHVARIGITRIKHLARLVESNPYARLVSFHDCVKSITGDMIESRRSRLANFIIEVRVQGFHNARGDYNRANNNFERDFCDVIPPLLVGTDQVPMEIVLFESLKRSLTEYFTAPQNSKAIKPLPSILENTFV